MHFRFKPPLQGVVATVGSLFGKGKDATTEADAVDVGDDGKALFKEDIIKSVLEKLEERRSERLPLEQQWTLNANFLCGNQYCEINPYRGKIEQLEPVYDWLEREAFNQIAPLIETRIANLKKITYMMKVKPATNELDDYAKAEVSTSILQYTQKNTDFESKNNTALYWNELCGNCFWLSWWDKDKGVIYATARALITDNEGNTHVTEQPLRQGELDYGLITPYEVFPESVFKRSIEAQRSIILEQVKTVEDIYDLYGIKVGGTSIETFELTPVVSGGGLGYENTTMALGHRTVNNAEKVITYFERPSRKYSGGRMIIIVGDSHLVYYGDLPYGNIPLVQMQCREVPGQFFGKSVIEDLIPRQRAYNGCLNRIHEFIKRVALGNMAVEEGSIDIEEHEENGLAPGAYLVYKSGSAPPRRIENGNLPSELMQERYNLKSDMEYVAGTSQLMVNGATPAGVTSGTAISNLMEIDNTRLSLTGEHIRNSIRKLAIQWLEIYKRYATTKRVVNYVGLNSIAKALVWSNEDINSYDVEFVTENELLMSEDIQRQKFFDLMNMGMFTDDDGRIPARVKMRAIEYSKVGNYTDLLNLNLLQIQAAQRENVFFEEGVVPDVSDFDEHEVHIDVHLRYILQMDFHILKRKKPEFAKLMEDHITAHKAAEAKAAQEAAINKITAQGTGLGM